jgi:hypothetical protein
VICDNVYIFTVVYVLIIVGAIICAHRMVRNEIKRKRPISDRCFRYWTEGLDKTKRNGYTIDKEKKHEKNYCRN